MKRSSPLSFQPVTFVSLFRLQASLRLATMRGDRGTKQWRTEQDSRRLAHHRLKSCPVILPIAGNEETPAPIGTNRSNIFTPCMRRVADEPIFCASLQPFWQNANVRLRNV